MDINDIKHLAVERIYLVPDASEGRLSYAWCDDPAPSEGMDASEAVEYVRKDAVDARIAELNRECDAYCATEEAQIALRQKMEEERDALAAHVERIVELLDGTIESNLDTAPEYDREVSQWLADTPANSLAHRDLIKQAEAVEYAAVNVAGWSSCQQLRDYAKKLRQQAEALNEPPA